VDALAAAQHDCCRTPGVTIAAERAADVVIHDGQLLLDAYRSSQLVPSRVVLLLAEQKNAEQAGPVCGSYVTH
jgi:hypothetical protein